MLLSCINNHLCMFFFSHVPLYLPTQTENDVIDFNENDVIENPIFEDTATPREVRKWTQDPDFTASAEETIGQEETKFWQELIDTYLFPLEGDKKEQAKTQEELLELRYSLG